MEPADGGAGGGPGPYRSVLVPLDASTFGEHALPLALSIAERCGATLHLVHVHTPVPMTEEADGVPQVDAALQQVVLEQERTYLERVEARVRERTDAPVVCRLGEGPVGRMLSRYAHENDTDLVVMATHAHGGLRRLLGHGAVERILRGHAAPVLAVRPGEEEPDWSAAFAPRHILVPVDGSEASARVLPAAARLARLFAARITLLHAVEETGDAEARHRHVDAARSDLQARLADPALAGLAVGVRVLTSGKPAAAILDVVRGSHDLSADPPPVDLIAMETEARGTISRLFEGSVAGDVLGESPVPVLLDHTEDAPAE